MSRYDTYKTQFKSLEALVACLRERFKDVEVHEKPETMYDWHGKVRPEKAEVIVRRQHVFEASNDLGFRRQKDGTFGAIVSDYDHSVGINDQWMSRLTVDYNKRVLIPHLQSQGFNIQTQSDQQGNLHVTMSRVR